jgi:hypothetical protein
VRLAPNRSAAIPLTCMLRREEEPGDIVAHPRGDESISASAYLFSRLRSAWGSRDLVAVHQPLPVQYLIPPLFRDRFGISENELRVCQIGTLAVSEPANFRLSPHCNAHFGTRKLPATSIKIGLPQTANVPISRILRSVTSACLKKHHIRSLTQ